MTLLSALKAASPKRQTGQPTHKPLHTGNTQAYLSSLSSRLTSFFCFRVSSRLRRASASSLTARSRSRLRLSHRVLVKKGEAMVTGNGKNAERAHSLYHTTYQPLFLRFSLIKHPDQPTMEPKTPVRPQCHACPWGRRPMFHTLTLPA